MKQGRAMSMQISPIKERQRNDSIDEMMPLSINTNRNKMKKRSKRVMSVPTNLMSDNTKTQSVWINEYDGMLCDALCCV